LTLFSVTGPLRARRAVTRAACAAATAAALAATVAAAAVPRPIVSLEVAGELSGEAVAGLERPRDVAVDHRGDIVIADAGNHRVLVVSPLGKMVREFGGYGWEEGRFDDPTDVAVYPGFYIYVLDRGNRRVQRFDAEGDYVDMPLAEGDAGGPTGIEVGVAGELLVVDEDSQVVRIFSQFDEVVEPIGHFGPEEGGLVSPAAIAVGPSREIAVADPGRAGVEVFDEFGTHLRSISAPDTLAPSALVFDRYGNLVVAEASRGRVVAYGRGGLPTASMGRDALGSSFEPAGLAFTPDGKLLVLDAHDGRLLWIRAEHGGDETRR
jgi:tripartite motif-containing protein 71